MNNEERHSPQLKEEKVVLSARISPALKKRLADLATAKGLTVSEYVETIVSSDLSESFDEESKIEVEKLRMIIASKEKEVDKLNEELDTISKQHLLSIKKNTRLNRITSNQQKIEKVLAFFYEQGIYNVNDKDFTDQGISWLSLPISGTTLYGQYKLISTSFWNESFRIEKV